MKGAALAGSNIPRQNPWRASSSGARQHSLRDRRDQEARADLEEGALRRWNAGVGRSGSCRAGLRRMSVTLRDSFGRSIEYLRISVTDRCNFRCLYCMPLAGLEWLPKADILSYEEIARVVAELAPLGLRRLRVTGGEPTLRPDLELLIGMLRAIPEIEDIL